MGARRRARGRSPAGHEQPGTALTDKSVPVRQAPPPANRHCHLCAGSLRGRWRGRQQRALCVQIGALPARLWAVWLRLTKTPGRRGGDELSPLLSQPPRSQRSPQNVRPSVPRLHERFLAMVMLAAYVSHTGGTFSLSFLNIQPSEELRMTSEHADLGVKRGTVSVLPLGLLLSASP